MTSTSESLTPERATTRRLTDPRNVALAAVLGPSLFTVGWLVLGFYNHGYTLFGTRIPNYSPLSQPISGLGMGRTAPIMNSVFVVNGVLLAVGLSAIFKTTARLGPTRLRHLSTALLLLIPAGSIIDGLCPLQSMKPHSSGFFLATGTPIIRFLVVGQYFRRIHLWRQLGTRLLIASPITLILFVLFFLTFKPTATGTEHGYAGLVQRVLVLEVFAWLVAMAIQARRSPDPHTDDHPASATRLERTGR
jgi:hypothetical protein